MRKLFLVGVGLIGGLIMSGIDLASAAPPSSLAAQGKALGEVDGLATGIQYYQYYEMPPPYFYSMPPPRRGYGSRYGNPPPEAYYPGSAQWWRSMDRWGRAGAQH